MTIKGSFILEHPHVKAVSAAKKTKSSQNRSPKLRFFGNFRGPNIKYSHQDPQKALPYPERCHLTYLRKYPSRGVGCSLIEEPKKTKVRVRLVDVIDCAKFYRNRFRGLDSMSGQSLTIPIGLRYRR